MNLPDFDAPPSVSTPTAVFVGLILPTPLVSYSIFCLIAERTYLPGKRATGVYIEGEPALWLAAAYLSFAMCFHFHYFWGSIAPLLKARYPLVLLSIAGFCVSLPTFIIKFLK
jgi:hypothetical protein